MASVSTIPQFARMMVNVVSHLPMAQHHALEVAAQMVEKEAKRVIGTYDYGWPELADSTKEDRTAKGFSENEPLLRTGEMRDSIQHTTTTHWAEVGSDNDKAVWQELGTARIPPRSFLAGAAIHEQHAIEHIVGDILHAHLTGGGQSKTIF